jgi:hypothetical protein
MSPNWNDFEYSCSSMGESASICQIPTGWNNYGTEEDFDGKTNQAKMIKPFFISVTCSNDCIYDLLFARTA